MAPPKPPGLTVWARLTLHRASEWPLARRKAVAQWLREQARSLVNDGGNYSPRFIARYMRD